MVSPPSPRTRLPPPSGRQLGETHQLSRPTLSARSRAAGSPRHPSWVALLHPGPLHGAGTKGREASGGDGRSLSCRDAISACVHTSKRTTFHFQHVFANYTSES